MKKLNIIMLVCAVVVTALLVVSLSVSNEVLETKKTPSCTSVYSSANATSSQGSSTAPASSAAVSSGARLAAYLVKSYNGEIGIFRVGETTPFRVLHVKTQSLPAADQQLLRSGISVQTSDELQRIVEDYIS